MSWEVIVVLHDVSSVQRIHDVAKLVYGFGDRYLFVISKPSGAAAQIGVPEISRTAYKNNKPLLVLPDIRDAIELLKPRQIFTISYKYGETINMDTIEYDEPLMIIVSGSEAGLSKEEAYLGKPVRLPTNDDVGPVASLAILMYILEEKKKRVKK